MKNFQKTESVEAQESYEQRRKNALRRLASRVVKVL